LRSSSSWPPRTSKSSATASSRSAGRLRLPALGRKRQLPAGPGRYLHFALADPPFLAATGDTVEGPIRGPKEGERYFALLKVNTINFEDPEKIRHKEPLRQSDAALSDERLKMEIEDPTIKDLSARHRPGRAARQGPACD
jgi:hypothetical protein